MAISQCFLLSVFLVVCLTPTVISGRFYGRNICTVVNDKPICCLGWSLDETNLHCSRPVCTGQCEKVGGRCIKPDVCLCPGGYLAYSCYTGKPRTGGRISCSITCRNGGICDRDRCVCPSGFSGERCEIAACPNDCSGRGKCRSDGSCECVKGYSGTDCSEEVKAPCYRSTSRGLCRDVIPNFKATRETCCNSIGRAWGDPCTVCQPSSCNKGFRYSTRDRRCEDIDECREIPNLCGGGACRNARGEFRCICRDGLTFNKETSKCEQESICKRDPRACGQGKCIPKGNDFTCSCYNGYVPSKDGKSCQTSVQYLLSDMCSYNRGYLCENGKCIPKGRSYQCRCNPGYETSQDGRSCKKKVDVCRLYGSSVCANGRCVPSGSDYICTCDPGYDLSSDQKKCTSICDRYGDSICPNGRCKPSSSNGYECECNSGYYQTTSRKSCAKSRREQRTVCDYYSLCANGRCIPRGRSYRCQCDPGYQTSTGGQSCEPVRRRKQHVCETYGDYYCPNARCIPDGDSYRCQCNAGYRMGSRGRCKPVERETAVFEVKPKPKPQPRRRDYCAAYDYLCKNGRCISTENYFYCECKPGYTAVDEKRRCRKVEQKPALLRSGLYDFCQHYRSQCRGGTCHNEPTKFWCTCLPSFRWDEKKLRCMPRTRRLVSDEWNAYVVERQKPRTWGQTSSRWRYSACERMGRDVCGKGYCVDQGSSFECRCNTGYMQARHNKRCVDINECDRRPNACWQGQCINTPGSYTCRCLKGYKLSHVNREPMCVDRNECEEGNPCLNGFCLNTWGSYRCNCNDNFKNDATGTQCVPKYGKTSMIQVAAKSVPDTKMVADESGGAKRTKEVTTVAKCSLCQYSCKQLENGRFKCNCPQGLTSLGQSDLCVENDSVAEYTFDIQMDDPEKPEKTTRRRRRRSVPDKEAASHLMARLILKAGTDVDKFVNKLTTKYVNTRFYKIIKLGETGVSQNGALNTVVDIIFI